MRNFKVGRIWGVLGKQQSYSGPTPPTGNKVPLNNNPMNSWDYKKSNYRRLDGRANAIQQGGAVPQDTPIPDVSPTPTPTITTTPTLTQTPTPSPQVQWNAEIGYYAGYSINSNNWFEIGYPTEGYFTLYNIASNGTRWAATGILETGFLSRTFYSDNGSTWITGNDSFLSFMGTPIDLTSNGDMFVLGGSSTYSQILSGNTFTTIGYSYDGITYSSGTITVESGRAKPSAIRSTAFNGDMWLGGGFSSGATENRTVMINSYDGINWSGITNTLWTGTTIIRSVTYGNGRWVAVSNLHGNDRIAVSYDGFNWTGSTNAADSTNFGTATGGFAITDVTWFNDKFIAGSSASGATTHTVCYSYDGFEWFPATSTKTLISSVLTIQSNKSDFVMIGGSPGGAIYQSPDGINWSANTTDQAVVFNNGTISRLANKLPEQQSPNPSQTPSNTPTNTPTPSITPEPTTTPTQTPTPTLTQTPIPFCLDIVSLTNNFGPSDTDGNYDYIGNGYVNIDTSSSTLTLYYGVAPDSINYSLYQSGATNYVVATFIDNVLDILGPYNYWDANTNLFGNIPSTISSGYVIPTNPSTDFTIDYPNCPLPTPTPTATSTQTPTPSTAAWTPAQFSNLWDWWSSNSGVNVSGNSVINWTGYSGNVLSAHSSSFYPDYISSDSNFNSQPSILVNSGTAQNDMGFTINLPSDNTSKTSIVIGRLNQKAASGDNILNTWNPGVDPRAGIFGVFNASDYLCYESVGGDTLTYTGNTNNNNTYQIIMMSYDRSGGILNYHMSNLTSGLTTPVEARSIGAGENFVGGKFGVLSYNGGYGYSPNMNIVEAVFINGVPSGSEITNYINYLSTKYGLS